MKWLSKGTGTLSLILFLILLPTPVSSGQHYLHYQTTVPEWIILVKAYSLAYHVDPNLSLALAETEGSKGNERFRFGLHGDYWLPFGIYVKCKVPRPNTPGGNAEAGIKALARHLRKCGGNLRAALHKYNVEPKGFEAYYQKILACERRNRREGIFK